MAEQQKFDDIIRSKFSEFKTPFKEENWEKAEDIIAADRRKRKRIRWVVIFMLGFLAGIGVLLPFIINEKGGTVKNISELTNQRKIENIASSIEKVEKAPDNPPYHANNLNDELTAQQNENKLIADKEQTLVITTPKQSAEYLVRADKNSEAKNQTIIPSNNKKSVDELQKINHIEKENSDDAIIANSENKPEQTDYLNKNNEQKKKQEETISAALPLKQNASDDTIAIQQALAQQNEIQPIKDSTDQLNQQIIVQNNSEDSAKKKIDSIASPTAQNDAPQPPAKQNLGSATIFSVDAGVNYVFGWSYGNDTSEARGFNPLLGLSITHFFNTTWSARAGIQYGSIAHLTQHPSTSSDTNFDFGYISVDTTIVPQLLHYIVFPVNLQHNFNNKNSIGLGCALSYLVNTTSNVISYTKNNFHLSEKKEERFLGYMDGFNTLDISLSLGYKRRITDKFTISAEMNYGLLDIKDNVFFSKQKSEKNLGIKLFVSYDLFNRQ